jgi:hypothetical protein
VNTARSTTRGTWRRSSRCGTAACVEVGETGDLALAIRSFYPLILPSYIQTSAYSRAVLDSFRYELPANVIEARLAIRAQRRDGFATRPNRPRFYAILDETVLIRPIGGTSVLAEQIKRLLDLIDSMSMRVRVIPMSSNAPVLMLATFEITYLQEESEDDAILYRESDVLDQIVDDPDQIRRHRAIFERLWGSIHDERASIELIKQRLKDLTEASE